MKRKRILGKVLSSGLLIAIYVFLSASAFAGRATGEIIIFSINDNDNPLVKVNGEAVQSGRILFSGSVIATDSNSGAVVSIKGAGKLELSPNTFMSLSFNENEVSADLSTGKITVLEGNASVRTLNGLARLSAGESVTAQQQQDDDDDGGFLIWVLLLGGAAAAIIAVAASRGNSLQLKGGSTVVSPTV